MNIHTHRLVAPCLQLFRITLLGLSGPMMFLSAATGAAAATCELSSSYAMTTPIIPSGAPNLVWTWSQGSTTPIVAIGCSAIYGNLWSLTSPMWINGKLQNGTFDVYAADTNLPNHTSELITFALRPIKTPGAPSGGLVQGTVGFNLQPLLLQMTNSLSAQFGWSKAGISAGYLNGLEIGQEFQASKAKAQLGWALSHYCFVAPKTGLPPTQANAMGFVCP